MNIAIDYDETYTCDPDVWNQIINIFQQNNHKVYCVTKRYVELADDIREAIDIPIIYATKSKLEAVRKNGIKIDVWIDDKPQSITPYKSQNKMHTNHVWRKI